MFDIFIAVVLCCSYLSVRHTCPIISLIGVGFIAGEVAAAATSV